MHNAPGRESFYRATRQRELSGGTLCDGRTQTVRRASRHRKATKTPHRRSHSPVEASNLKPDAANFLSDRRLCDPATTTLSPCAEPAASPRASPHRSSPHFHLSMLSVDICHNRTRRIFPSSACSTNRHRDAAFRSGMQFIAPCRDISARPPRRLRANADRMREIPSRAGFAT